MFPSVTTHSLQEAPLPPFSWYSDRIGKYSSKNKGGFRESDQILHVYVAHKTVNVIFLQTKESNSGLKHAFKSTFKS